MNDVIKPNSILEGTGKKNRRILVVDRLGTKIISSCCSMCDIYDEGIIREYLHINIILHLDGVHWRDQKFSNGEDIANINHK